MIFTLRFEGVYQSKKDPLPLQYIVVKQCKRMQSDFNCFVALSTPDRNRVKNCVVPCWCCVGPRLWASRWALLLCSAYWKRITRNLHQNKERAITAISLEHIVSLFRYTAQNIWYQQSLNVTDFNGFLAVGNFPLEGCLFFETWFVSYKRKYFL